MSASRHDLPGSLACGRAARRRLGWWWLGAVALLACTPGPQRAVVADAATEPAPKPAPDPKPDAGTADAAPAPVPEAAHVPSNTTPPGFCLREGADAVRDLFCDAGTPAITSLRQLQQLLALDAYRAAGGGYYPTEDGGVPSRSGQTSDAGVVLNLNAVLLGHSTALSGSLVSPINPRAILMGETTLLAFQRGVQRVELATQARDQARLNFYLVSFVQACNEAPAHCSPGDLYTPRIESDWQHLSVQDDEELKNSSSDCRQCHQRGMDSPMLLMRERNGPWTHFFAHDRDDQPDFAYPEPSGKDLVLDYRQAKGAEPYAALPVPILRGTIGLALEVRVRLEQPLEFDGATILNERWTQEPDGTWSGPKRSATWDRAYQAFKRGERLALPYFSTRATDPAKQSALSAAYQRFRAGELSAEALPDLADIYPDDPQTRAEIGLQTEPGASAAEVLIQACGSCHNDVLDQTITRARFNIDLSRMDEHARLQAIARIELPADGEGVMPPHETRQLDAEGRKKLIAYLHTGTRSAEDDALLTRAAALGMAVPPEKPALLPVPY